MPIEAFDHFTIRAADLEGSRRFYQEALGLQFEVHNDFAFPVGLVFVGGHPLLHLLQTGAELDAFMDRPAPAFRSGAERGTGNLEHVAFSATGLSQTMGSLRDLGIGFRERSMSEHGVYQLLIDDPDGIELEINFPAAEAPD